MSGGSKEGAEGAPRVRRGRCAEGMGARCTYRIVHVFSGNGAPGEAEGGVAAVLDVHDTQRDEGSVQVWLVGEEGQRYACILWKGAQLSERHVVWCKDKAALRTFALSYLETRLSQGLEAHIVDTFLLDVLVDGFEAKGADWGAGEWPERRGAGDLGTRVGSSPPPSDVGLTAVEEEHRPDSVRESGADQGRPEPSALPGQSCPPGGGGGDSIVPAEVRRGEAVLDPLLQCSTSPQLQDIPDFRMLPDAQAIVVMRDYFALPIREAMVKLSCCASVLKRICRKFAIRRWPYRKVQRLQRLMTLLRQRMDTNEVLDDEAEKCAVRRQLESDMRSLERELHSDIGPPPSPPETETKT